jgi:hypothetical protein
MPILSPGIESSVGWERGLAHEAVEDGAVAGKLFP